MPGCGGHIVLIEDDASLCRVVEYSLQSAGYALHVAENKHDGILLVKEVKPRLIISDLCLGDSNGLDVLSELVPVVGNALILIITGHGSVQQAVDAIRLGAFDYLQKPFSREQLLLAVYKALTFKALQKDNTRLKAALVGKGYRTLLGDSPGIQLVHDLVGRMSSTAAPVLILGESGTGKELVARLLHEQSFCSKGPFVPVNCAAIPADLLESELYGHVRGSFTGANKDRKGKFELAEGGTLFLDEIGELPLSLQPKLLRALQEQEIAPVGGSTKGVNVRIIAATNADLERDVSSGAFREDLYYRLAVLPLTIPPLRERVDDISVLAQHFIRKYSDGREMRLSEAALQVMQKYPWPGNVRELENLIQRLVILSRNDRISKSDLPLHIQLNTSDRADRSCVSLPRTGAALAEIERQAITQALMLCSGNVSKAARLLRVPRHVLAYRIEKYAIDREPSPE
jgi:two-component system NtrC family response regulator